MVAELNIWEEDPSRAYSLLNQSLAELDIRVTTNTDDIATITAVFPADYYTSAEVDAAIAAYVTAYEVPNSQLADMAEATIKGRSSGSGAGAPEDLDATAARTILDVYTTTEVDTAITDHIVDNDHLADMAQDTFKGRISTGTGVPEDLDASDVISILGLADVATSGSASDLDSGTLNNARLATTVSTTNFDASGYVETPEVRSGGAGAVTINGGNTMADFEASSTSRFQIQYATSPSVQVNLASQVAVLNLSASTSVRSNTITASTTGSGANVFINNSTSGTLQRSTSAKKYKTNIRTLTEDEASAIMAVTPVVYTSLCELDDPEREFIGIVADDVVPIEPRLVDYDGEEVEGFEYSRLTAVLLKVCQMQQTQIDSLISRVNALEV